MRRLQLFEFLDQAWLPLPIRTAAARYLEAAYRTSPFPALWAAKLARVLREFGVHQIVDIGSGSGGPVALVMKHLAVLRCSPRVTLTDLHPAAATSGFEYWPIPVDGQRVPVELRGVRTLFLSFHHFAPSSARAVLNDASEKGQPICIFEATSRTPPALAATLLVPLLVLLITPSIRPVSKFQIVFTYLIPLLPLLLLWDGLVSQLRTYSLAELRDLSAGMTSDGYAWEYGFIEAPMVPFRTCYTIGYPGKTQ